MPSLHAVVMAGGSGTRFWPASRTRRPKQFLPLVHGVPLLQATLDRLRGFVPPEQTWIVTNPLQAAALPEVVPEFPPSQVLVEPEARDTAPCVALATAAIAARDPHATMALLPADHVIEPLSGFHGMLRRGAQLAADHHTLVTFGIAPRFAATGYGYVECGEPLDGGAPPAWLAKRFREKPDLATAQQFLAAGNFLWNSGIFVWTVPAIQSAMAVGNPALAAACAAMQAQAHDPAAFASAFRSAPKTSIDYAILERARRIAVVAAPVQWDDVGSFPALAGLVPPDAAGNHAVCSSGASASALQSHGNVIYAEGPRTVALFGVHDLVVVAVGDAVLVCPKQQAADLKTLVDHLRATGRADLL